MAKAIVLDTSFWIALYYPSDRYHEDATNLLTAVNRLQPIIYLPWPICYEVLRTKFVKNKNWVRQFKIHLDQLPIRRIDDSSYREKAFDATITEAIKGQRRISLVDMVIRHVLEDRSLKIDYLITYNQKDFVDVCKKTKIGLQLL